MRYTINDTMKEIKYGIEEEECKIHTYRTEDRKIQ